MNVAEVKSRYGLAFDINAINPMYRGAEVAKYDTIIKQMLERGEDVEIVKKLMEDRNAIKAMKIDAQEEANARAAVDAETSAEVVEEKPTEKDGN